MMLHALALLGLLGCAPAPAPPAGDDAERGSPHPDYNVVLVLSDALRAANVGPWGYPRPTTPTLDALAEQALVFEHAFAHYPGTPVSVSQLFTGRYRPPLLMGARLFAVPTRAVPQGFPVLPTVLHDAGYLTGMVSSHPWWTDDARLVERFDAVELVPPGDRAYAPFEALLPAVERFLDRAGERPFFLFVHSMDTHGPWTDLDPDLDDPAWPEAYSRLDTDVRRTDRGVAALVAALEARGQWERTVFAFTSDHGDEFNEVGPEPWNRNHGLQVRRPVAEVPLLVRLPGGEAARRPEPVGLVDLAPTLVGLARPGLRFGPSDGRDLSAAWATGAPGDPEAVLFGASGRFLAAYTAELDLIRDPWTGTEHLYRVTRDARNYPRLVPDGSEPAPLSRALDEALARHAAFEATLPALDGVAHGAQIHVPFALARPPGPIRFADLPDDGMWSHPGPELRAWPGEAGPIALTRPWAPGRYRVVLSLGGEDPTWNRELQVRFNGGPLRTPIPSADRRTAVVEPVVIEGRTLALTVVPGSTGVALRALRFERLDGGVDADPDLARALEALGYLVPGDPSAP